ncbi:MAG: bifunctional 2-C-methyl-D-erythritol 4-phosphate cytidylyltransferase/2-C-methyl-D-erythritol 2,4-cyclodiphosphate synthase [Hyphomicrobiaceae bacterium]
MQPEQTSLRQMSLPGSRAAGLIVAAGRGSRMASDEGPKQYRLLAGRPVLAWSMTALLQHSAIDHVLVVIHPDDEDLYQLATLDAVVQAFTGKLLQPVHGGSTRQQSVRAGLEALAGDAPDVVLIHDAARPLVDPATITKVAQSAKRTGGAIAAAPLADTLKRAGTDRDGQDLVSETVPREGLWRAQTPQGFHFEAILRAHRSAAELGLDATDDAAIATAAGLAVELVNAPERNFKITTQSDLAMAQETLRNSGLANSPDIRPDIRVGSGFDVHAFGPGDHVWICGIRIPHTHALVGHSDADVALHALTDAVLGALADGDIGAHFPPSDPKWKGAASDQFLAHAASRVAARGGRIANVDVTLLCEAPKIGPHRDAMRARVAEILGIEIGRVAVKATTTEGLGFTGRREGIAATASATVFLT